MINFVQFENFLITFLLSALKARANCTATVLLPTPPLPESTNNICFTSGTIDSEDIANDYIQFQIF